MCHLRSLDWPRQCNNEKLKKNMKVHNQNQFSQYSSLFSYSALFANKSNQRLIFGKWILQMISHESSLPFSIHFSSLKLVRCPFSNSFSQMVSCWVLCHSSFPKVSSLSRNNIFKASLENCIHIQALLVGVWNCMQAPSKLYNLWQPWVTLATDRHTHF